MYDTIIIGGGPISILEAIYLSKKGKKILLIDEKKLLGGAWGTFNYKNWKNLEYGCHIWDIHSEALNFINSNLKIQLLPLLPAPLIMLMGIQLPYDWKNFISIIRDIRESFKKKSLGFLLNQLKEPKNQIRLFPKNFLYPSRGSGDLITVLQNKLIETAAKIQLETFVEKIHINCKSKTLTIFTSRDEFSCNELVITSVCNVNAVGMDAEEEEEFTPRSVVNYSHVHLFIEDQTKAKFSYIRVMNHEHIHRISDMSSQQTNNGIDIKNLKIICFGIYFNEKLFNNKAKLTDLLFSFLIKNKLIGLQSCLVDFTSNIYPVNYLGDENIIKIQNKYSPYIRFLRSTNLIYGIGNYTEKWKQVI